MARTVSFYTDAALAAFEAGFTSKSAKEEALKDLNRAADLLRAEIHGLVFDLRKTEPARNEALEELYWYNTDLHLWNAKRRAAVLAWAPEAESICNQYDDLAALRAQIKVAEVNKVVKAEDPKALEVQSTIRALMEKRKAQYARGLELKEIFGRLPVYANVHMVTNQQGTTFLRTFYYMHDKLTPLNVILAVLQAGEEA